MLDAFREETIVRKVGGRFRLSSLIQKRMVALNRGARPLVEVVANNPMLIVVEEILNDKIYLDNTGNVAIADGAPDLDQILQEPGAGLQRTVGRPGRQPETGRCGVGRYCWESAGAWQPTRLPRSPAVSFRPGPVSR